MSRADAMRSNLTTAKATAKWQAAAADAQTREAAENWDGKDLIRGGIASVE